MDRLQAITKQLLGFWRSLSTLKRLALVVVTGGVLVGVLLMSVIGTSIRYGYLYTELESQDAAAIAQKLEELQVPYRVEAGGSTIRVPDEQVAKLRLELASQGLPRGGGVGFELFDESRIGATEFEQNVNLRRALEGELTRSILTVEGVKAARVHLVMPERRLFAAREESASASVVLKLDNPASFGRKEVAAVAHLVSAAVPGLARDRISVVSTDGVTLHRPSEGGGVLGGIGGEESAERAANIASQMQNSVLAQIERVVGPGNADVRVHVELDPTMRERTEEHYEPAKTALRSEKLSEESAAGTGAPGVAGVPGALSNLPEAGDEAQVAETAPTGSGVFRRSHTRNWEVDRVSEKIVAPPGTINRLSVAVLVNGTYAQKGTSTTYVPRSQEQLAKLEALVERAIGANAERGDVVTVKNFEFARPSLIEDVPLPPLPLWKRWWPHVAAGLGALFVLSLVVLAWRSGRRGERRVTVQQLAGGGEADPALPAGVAPARQLLSSQKLDSRELRALAVKTASEDSASAALVLRGWLNSGNSPTNVRGELARN